MKKAEDPALHTLLAAVEAEPSAFDFYDLLRRIDALRPHEPRTGEALRPRQEAIRLGQSPELDFASAPIDALQQRGDLPPRLTQRFFGLLGPMGPMPLHFTEFVRERLRHHDDTTLPHFLDLFHHRMLSLFYRAWAQAQPVVHQDRPAGDRFQVWLGALAGSSQGGVLPPHWVGFQTGWLAQRSAHPEMLTKVLGHTLSVPVRVEENVGHWLALDKADHSRLGFARSRPERSLRPAAQLGVSANAGGWVWDRQFRFRLHLGPLSMAQYSSLLPGGTDWQPLNHAVELVAGRDKTWDLALELRPQDRPEPRLGRVQRLGVTSWLGQPNRSRRAPRGLTLRPQTSFLNTRNRPT